jgi:hypothetical protein
MSDEPKNIFKYDEFFGEIKTEQIQVQEGLESYAVFGFYQLTASDGITKTFQ